MAHKKASKWRKAFTRRSTATPNPAHKPEPENVPHHKEATILSVHRHQEEKILATVVLNGYNIRSNLTAQRGAMRSFKLIEGNLHNEWEAQTALIIRDGQGHEAAIKIAALPVEKESSGLIEFV